MVKIFGHRGFSAAYPENTMLAFEEALAAGCDGVEFDVQLTRDNVPVIIHDREAHGDCMELLRLHRDGLKGVMHCFSGSYETGRDCVDLGLYIAFGGALTFKNAVHLWDAAARLPLERLLIETDCPYMTPVPFRGQRNDPTRMALTLQKLAALRGMEVEPLAEVLYQNSLAAFGVVE